MAIRGLMARAAGLKRFGWAGPAIGAPGAAAGAAALARALAASASFSCGPTMNT